MRRRGIDGGMVEMGVWGGNGGELGREGASGLPWSQISEREREGRGFARVYSLVRNYSASICLIHVYFQNFRCTQK